jgi:hypothetical protein
VAFVVLQADLIDSREVVHDTAGVAAVERAVEIARKSSSNWPGPVAMTAGIDEAQGVSRSIAGASAVAHAMERGVWPLRYRFCFARGEVTHGLDAGRSAQMDGPAFHAAADGIEQAKASDRTLVVAGVGGDLLPRTLETLWRARAMVMNGWTERQAEIVFARLDASASGESQRDTAARLGVTPQAVSKALSRGHAELYAELSQRIEELTLRLDGEGEPA